MMGATPDRPPEIDRFPIPHPAPGSRHQHQHQHQHQHEPNSSALYSLLQAAAGDAFASFPADAKGGETLVENGEDDANATRSSSSSSSSPRRQPPPPSARGGSPPREGGLLVADAASDLRRFQAERLGEYDGMVGVARARRVDDDDDRRRREETVETTAAALHAAVAAAAAAAAAASPGKAPNDEISQTGREGPSSVGKLLALLREAAFDDFLALPDPKKGGGGDHRRPRPAQESFLPRGGHHRRAAGNVLRDAVSDLRCDQISRMDEYRIMVDIAMTRSDDDDDDDDDDAGGGAISERRMRAFVRAATSPVPPSPAPAAAARLVPPKVETVYRPGQGLSAEVASVRREISRRVDERGAMCDRYLADAAKKKEKKSTKESTTLLLPPPRARPAASASTPAEPLEAPPADDDDDNNNNNNNVVSEEELLSLVRKAASPDLSALTGGDAATTDSLLLLGGEYPVRGREETRSLLRRADAAADELRRWTSARLAAHEEMCRVAASRSGASSEEELSSLRERAASPDFSPPPPPRRDAPDTNSLLEGKYPVVGGEETATRLRRTDAADELRREVSARLASHREMCRVAASRPDASDAEEGPSAKAKAAATTTKRTPPSIASTTPVQAKPAAAAAAAAAPKKAPTATIQRSMPIPMKASPVSTLHTGINFGATAPRFTEKDEEREKAALTDEEKAEAEASVRGRKLPPTPPVSEYDSLDELELELGRVPELQKADFVEAEARCPEIARDDATLLLFLRCVDFDAGAASRRVAAYWKRRVELFGKDKAFRPLSVETSLAADGEALATGSYRILPEPDDSGRRVIVYSVRRQRPDLYPRDSMLRYFWYMVEATLEKVHPNANGYVVLLNPADGTQEVFDRKLCKFMVDLDRDCLPTQITAWHHLLSTSNLRLYAPYWKHQLGPRIRRVLTVHSSEGEENLELLAQCGLTPDRLMTELGGGVKLDHDEWLKKRRHKGI